jgi:hypothetical protein
LSSITICFQVFKEDTTKEKSYGSFECKGVKKEIALSEVMDAMNDCIVRPFQLFYGLGKYDKNTNHPWTTIIMRVECPKKNATHRAFLQRNFGFDPGGENRIREN